MAASTPGPCGLAPGILATDDFKPSDIILGSATPLTATFGRTQREFAAAFMVLLCLRCPPTRRRSRRKLTP